MAVNIVKIPGLVKEVLLTILLMSLSKITLDLVKVRLLTKKLY